MLYATNGNTKINIGLHEHKNKAGAMFPKIFGDRNFAFGAMSPKFGTVEGWICPRKVIVPKTM